MMVGDERMRRPKREEHTAGGSWNGLRVQSSLTKQNP